jgi:eukaryotic-like serine/threonine-protein kinase
MARVPEKTLERYELVERIAVGGMAEVFRAKAFGAHGFEKTLAIKRILPELARDPEFEQRFIGEAKLAVQLTHANVVQVFDFGRFAESLFIAMEYVDGLDLAALLKRYRDRGERVPMPAAFQIAIELARGLDFAHQHGVVHRDVSPSNILLSRAGEVKIADFGIALAAASEVRRGQSRRRRIMGKWRYMSPEQTRGETLGTRSDLFSAASVIFELFTGEKLFPGDEADQIIQNIHEMPLPQASSLRAGVPPEIDAVLGRALEREPDGRYGKAVEMVRALTEISYKSSIVATSLEVAEAVAAVLDEPAGDPGDTAARALGIDDLIRQQLGDAAPAPGTNRRTAVDTEIDGEPAATDGDAKDAKDAEGAGEARERTATVVRKGVDSDGLTVWELEQDTIAAVPSAIRLGKRTGSEQALSDGGDEARRGGGLRWALVAMALAAAGASAWVTWGRSAGPASAPGLAAAVADAATGSPRLETARLQIESTPPGASVWIDGAREDDVTPLSVEVAPGVPYRVEVELSGHHRRAIEEVMVHRPGETLVERVTLEPIVAALRVVTTPPGATVTLDGAEIGTTPLSRQDLRPGLALPLTITRAGFHPVEETVDLRAETPAVVERTLRSTVRYGHISLQIRDSWADVYLQGRRIGRAPSPSIRLPVGTHRLRLHNPASDKETTLTVEVREGETTAYTAAL